MAEQVAVLDFGSQYTQVIARRIREAQVLSRIYRYDTSAEELRRSGVCGIILSGGPASVLVPGAPIPDRGIFELGVPVLGVCYGLQLLGHLLDGEVIPSSRREFGHGQLSISGCCPLFEGLPLKLRVWNSHGDALARLPGGFTSVGTTENSNYAAVQDKSRRFFGLQFHPEVFHTERGSEIYRNFLFKVCGCRGDWSMASYVDNSVREIRQEVGQSNVILALSGGVDSSVAAALIQRAIGDRLTCVFVDNGLLRLGEREAVEKIFRKNFRIKLRVVRAGRLFLSKLKGVTDPERKRKIIGRVFIEVFEAEVKMLKDIRFLAQGTLYPDVIESVPVEGNPAALIKSHHNVGGLPKRMKLKLLEPVRELFKDEVRALGKELGLPQSILWRQPFPGPGLGVRIVGALTMKRLKVLRQADAILLEEMKASDHYYKVWQSFAVFLPVHSVGVMGDERTYENVIVLRVVESTDAMTADWAQLPYELLGRISNRIINEVKGVNRVCYDISSKPPSTIEWE